MTVFIFVATCVVFLMLILFKPAVTVREHTVNIYWLAPVVGAIAMLLCGRIGMGEVLSGITADTEINPIKILVLFLSMTLMSILLDSAGFFRYLASLVLRRAKTSQLSLFAILYITVSVLTVFTSNDIIVLTFTPFICYFAHNAKINALPYLIGEFVAANTWSMALIIGNPTNIYLMTGTGISFAEYTAIMLLPTLLAGGISFGILYLIFHKTLKKPLEGASEVVEPENKPLVILGISFLAACIFLMVVSSYLSLPMWLISLVACLGLLLSAFVLLTLQKRGYGAIRESFLRIPYEIVPFILSMFVLVLSLEKAGVTEAIAGTFSGMDPILGYGLQSFLCSNLINNIPMSVLYSSIITGLSGAEMTGALFAAVAGSNIGAFLTPVGALAGIMWIGMLKKQGERLSFAGFLKYGSAVALPAMLAAIVGLEIVL